MGAHYSICVLLIEHGADVNAVDSAGQYPPAVYHAVRAGSGTWAEQRKILELLFLHGARITPKTTPGAGNRGLIEMAIANHAPADVV
jgi:hypothetical protein